MAMTRAVLAPKVVAFCSAAIIAIKARRVPLLSWTNLALSCISSSAYLAASTPYSENCSICPTPSATPAALELKKKASSQRPDGLESRCAPASKQKDSTLRFTGSTGVTTGAFTGLAALFGVATLLGVATFLGVATRLGLGPFLGLGTFTGATTGGAGGATGTLASGTSWSSGVGRGSNSSGVGSLVSSAFGDSASCGNVAKEEQGDIIPSPSSEAR
mmetsp:Transcript_73200/g.161592  ORF Transcript_73200/g.161592 Transcript_73200/m.161592 type:complete len:217 (-) Transcript_73200:520-1170(-)